MRLPEAKIKQAILHSELPVRTLALDYFSRSISDDSTVMPFVVEAVEKFGREASIHLVGEGENLPQTASTIQWCLEELRRDFDEQDEYLDDYRFALSKVLASADPSLTLNKESEILELLKTGRSTYPCSRCARFAFIEPDVICHWCRHAAEVPHEA